MIPITEKNFLSELFGAIPEFKEIHDKEKEYHDIGIHLIFGDFRRLAELAVEEKNYVLLKRIEDFIIRCHQESKDEVNNAVFVSFFENMNENSLLYFIHRLPIPFKDEIRKFLTAFDLATSKLDDSDRNILADFSARRKVFDEHIKQKDIKLFSCPSCGYPTLGERGGYEICSICDWEVDNQDDPKADELWGGPNSNLSLTRSRLQIGKVLKELSENLKGDVNLNPDDVLKILSHRDKEIESFRKEKITMTTDVSNPVWKEYEQLKKNTLTMLINKKL